MIRRVSRGCSILPPKRVSGFLSFGGGGWSRCAALRGSCRYDEARAEKSSQELSRRSTQINVGQKNRLGSRDLTLCGSKVLNTFGTPIGRPVLGQEVLIVSRHRQLTLFTCREWRSCFVSMVGATCESCGAELAGSRNFCFRFSEAQTAPHGSPASSGVALAAGSRCLEFPARPTNNRP